MTHRLAVVLALLFAPGAAAQFRSSGPPMTARRLFSVHAAAHLRNIAESAGDRRDLSLSKRNGHAHDRTAGVPTELRLDCHNQGNPQISGDGDVFSYTNYTYCGGHIACSNTSTTSASAISVGGKPYATVTGEAQISANGRHVYTDQLYPVSVAPAFANTSQLLDLQTGTTTRFPAPVAVASRQALTNDGQVLMLVAGLCAPLALALWSAPGNRAIATAEPPVAAIISANAASVV